MTSYEPFPARIDGAQLDGAGLDAVDELLDVADLTPAEAEALHAFLAGAAGPARPNELAGEAAAVSAFRAANRAPVAVPGRSWTRRLAAVVTVKALVLTGMSLGGVALAASTGVLPTPLTAKAPKAPKAETVRPADARAGKAAGQGTRDAAEPGGSNPARGAVGEPARADAAFPGVCGAWARRAEASDARGFARLAAAAGGQGRASAFCAGPPADGSEATDRPRDKSSGHGRSDDRGSSGQAGKSEHSAEADEDRDDRSGKGSRDDRSGKSEDGDKSHDDGEGRSGKSVGKGTSDAKSDRSGDSDGGEVSDDDSDLSGKSERSGKYDSVRAHDN